jgi:hypothetical protein
MRTEGVIVESLPGQATTLNAYSQELQEQAVRERKLNNDLRMIAIEKNKLGIRLINDKDEEAAKIFEKVFPCCKPSIFLLWPPKENKNSDEKTEPGVP